jgi:hypothetical protein
VPIILLSFPAAARLNSMFVLSFLVAASTFSSTAIMFAKTTLHMTSSSCVLIAFLAQITGIVGGLACPTIQKRLGWSNRRSIVVLLCAMICLPIYGCVGLLLGGEGAGGLRTPLEMYIVAGLFGRSWSRSPWVPLRLSSQLHPDSLFNRFRTYVWASPVIQPDRLLGAHPSRRGGSVLRAVFRH